MYPALLFESLEIDKERYLDNGRIQKKRVSFKVYIGRGEI